MAIVEDMDDEFIEPITLEETKDYLGIPNNSRKDDAFIERLIKAARSGLEDFLGRTIVYRRLRYRTKDLDGPYFLTPYLDTVEAVLYDIWDMELREWITVDCLKYTYDAGEDSTLYADIPRNAKNVRIEYTAGFEEVPEAIRMALLEIVKMKFDRTDSNPYEVVRPSIQKWKVEIL